MLLSRLNRLVLCFSVAYFLRPASSPNCESDLKERVLCKPDPERRIIKRKYFKFNLSQCFHTPGRLECPNVNFAIVALEEQIEKRVFT